MDAHPTLSVFHSPAGEEQIMQAYQAVLDHWPVPCEQRFIATNFGETHVIVSGPQDAPPLVLLHALLASAAAWYRNVEALSQRYRVYAVDVLGEANLSRPIRPIKSLDDYLQWFNELIAGLALESFGLAGNSNGGFIAAYFAMKLPERVRKLILIGPAATIHSMTPFYLHMFIPKSIYMLLPGLPGLAIAMRRSVDWMHAGLPPDPLWEPLFYRLLMYGNALNQVFPRVYTREEFAQIKAPVLLILGEQEMIYKPEIAAQAAREIIPNLQVELIPDAHHITALAQPERVNPIILNFLES